MQRPPNFTREAGGRPRSMTDFMLRSGLSVTGEKKFLRALTVLKPFWKLVENRESELGALLYDDLFSKHEEYRKLFKGDNPHTATQIVKMLTHVINIAEGDFQFPTLCFRLGGPLQYYGELHNSRGVPAEAYDHLWQSFDDVFHHEYGREWREYKDAFKFVYDMCRNAMCGYNFNMDNASLYPIHRDENDLKHAYERNDNAVLLLTAAHNGDSETAKRLLQTTNVDVNCQEADAELGTFKNGFTPLIWAAHSGHVDVAKVLLRQKADVNKADTGARNSPLIWASKQGNEDVVKLLLSHEQSPNINQTNKYNYTALMEAAEKGKKNIVGMLLEHDRPPDINVVNEKGYTAVMRAARRGHYNTLTQLLENDPPPNLRVLNNYGKTIFDLIITEMLTKSNYRKEIFRDLRKQFFFHEPHFVPFEKLSKITALPHGTFGWAFKAEMSVGITFHGNDITVPVVCKVPKLNAGADEWHEVQTLQNLPHDEHVISLLAMCTGFEVTGQSKRTATIVIYKEGGSLEKHLIKRKSSLTFKRILEFGLDMAKAVHHMHVHGYKHCDIAARNFLLSEVESEYEFNPKQKLALTDFGLTRPIDFISSDDTLVPVRWCAPEILLRGPRELSQRSDIWMLGIAFWELLHYADFHPEPFGHVEDKDLAMELCKENLSLYIPKQCPRIWRQMIEKCCNVFVRNRPTAKQIVVEIENILRSEVVECEMKNNRIVCTHNEDDDIHRHYVYSNFVSSDLADSKNRPEPRYVHYGARKAILERQKKNENMKLLMNKLSKQLNDLHSKSDELSSALNSQPQNYEQGEGHEEENQSGGHEEENHSSDRIIGTTPLDHIHIENGIFSGDGSHYYDGKNGNSIENKEFYESNSRLEMTNTSTTQHSDDHESGINTSNGVTFSHKHIDHLPDSLEFKQERTRSTDSTPTTTTTNSNDVEQNFSVFKFISTLTEVQESSTKLAQCVDEVVTSNGVVQKQNEKLMVLNKQSKKELSTLESEKDLLSGKLFSLERENRELSSRIRRCESVHRNTERMIKRFRHERKNRKHRGHRRDKKKENEGPDLKVYFVGCVLIPAAVALICNKFCKK